MITKETNKGNIPLDKKFLNKYSSAREIFDSANIILKNKKPNIRLTNIPEIDNLNLNLIKINNLKKVASEIFFKYHKNNIFINDNNFIVVTKHGIDESIQKIYNNFEQRDYLKEHLIILSSLGKVIEDSILISQAKENKQRPDLLYWNYYLDNLYINSQKYILQFDVRSMQDGNNQYRVQRIILKQEKTS